MKTKQTTLGYNTKNLQEIKPMLLFPLWVNTYHSQLQTWITQGTALKPIHVLMATYVTTKTDTLTTTFQKPAGEANPYVRFGYGPLTIFNHTRGQVSVELNADTINMMHTSQQ